MEVVELAYSSSIAGVLMDQAHKVSHQVLVWLAEIVDSRRGTMSSCGIAPGLDGAWLWYQLKCKYVDSVLTTGVNLLKKFNVSVRCKPELVPCISVIVVIVFSFCVRPGNGSRVSHHPTVRSFAQQGPLAQPCSSLSPA